MLVRFIYYAVFTFIVGSVSLHECNDLFIHSVLDANLSCFLNLAIMRMLLRTFLYLLSRRRMYALLLGLYRVVELSGIPQSEGLWEFLSQTAFM